MFIEKLEIKINIAATCSRWFFNSKRNKCHDVNWADSPRSRQLPESGRLRSRTMVGRQNGGKISIFVFTIFGRTSKLHRSVYLKDDIGFICQKSHQFIGWRKSNRIILVHKVLTATSNGLSRGVNRAEETLEGSR